jgi:ATP-dependent Clp protease ATP-binding subunit ClpA
MAADPRLTDAFQRVVQRAILDAQASGESPITGAHVLFAILSEHDSAAVQKLGLEGLDVAAVRKFARRHGS